MATTFMHDHLSFLYARKYSPKMIFAAIRKYCEARKDIATMIFVFTSFVYAFICSNRNKSNRWRKIFSEWSIS
jgi:hypothetical protein